MKSLYFTNHFLNIIFFFFLTLTPWESQVGYYWLSTGEEIEVSKIKYTGTGRLLQEA